MRISGIRAEDVRFKSNCDLSSGGAAGICSPGNEEGPAWDTRAAQKASAASPIRKRPGNRERFAALNTKRRKNNVHFFDN